MIKMLEQAIEKVKTLSEERQRYAAQVLEQIAEADDDVYRLSDEERRLVREVSPISTPAGSSPMAKWIRSGVAIAHEGGLRRARSS